MIKMIVVDDHPVVREGLSTVLGDEPDLEVVTQASSGEEALRVLAKTKVDVVVLDLRMPGMSGIETCSALVKARKRRHVLMVSSQPTGQTLLDIFHAGAHGFVVKESDPATLRIAVRQLAGGMYFIDPRTTSLLVQLALAARKQRDLPHGLTPQEARVLSYLPQGLSNREIAVELGIATGTVKSHLRKGMAKIGVADRAEAAAIVLREGLG